MDFRDRTTDTALNEIARLLSAAYQRYRRARRIESAAKDAPETVNGKLDIPRPESLHAREEPRSVTGWAGSSFAERLRFFGRC